MNRFSVKSYTLPGKKESKQGTYESNGYVTQIEENCNYEYEWICNADLRKFKCLQFNQYFDVTSRNLASGNLSPFEEETRKERRKQTESKK